jgi:hypothetical protein
MAVQPTPPPRGPVPAPPAAAAPPSSIAPAPAPSPIAPPHAPALPWSGDPNALPPVLAEKVRAFEEWAVKNEREAQQDTISFWMLKIPAMVISASSGLLALTGSKLLAAIAGIVASLCVLIDGLNPRGRLRNAHRLALYDLRNFQSRLVTPWQAGILEGKEPNALTADLLKQAQVELERVSAYLVKAEELVASKSP